MEDLIIQLEYAKSCIVAARRVARQNKDTENLERLDDIFNIIDHLLDDLQEETI